jgi:hypothetical protein
VQIHKKSNLYSVVISGTSSFSMCCASATFSFDLLTLACFSDMKSRAAESVCRAGINLITSLVSGGGTPLSPSNSVRCSEVPYVQWYYPTVQLEAMGGRYIY